MTNQMQIRDAIMESLGLGEDLRDVFFTPIDLNRAVRVEEANVQIQTGAQFDSDLRKVKPGSGSATVSNGEWTVSTDASGSSRQALETGPLAEYVAGIPGAAGLYIEKDSTPVGYVEAGYGGNVFNDELRWHWAADGTPRFDRVRGGTRATIPQSDWQQGIDQKDVTNVDGSVVGEVTGFDPLDGTGPSEIDVSFPFTGMVGVDMVLYGGGGVAPWVVDLTTERVEKIYPFVFNPKNESIVQQLNQPVFARIDNDGTATADSVILKDLQFTLYGEGDTERRRTPHIVQKAETISTSTALTVLRRRDAGGPTRTDLLEVTGKVDNDAHLYFLVDPTITNTPTWEQPTRDTAGNKVAASETAIEASDDANVDATTGVALDSALFEGGKGSSSEGGRSKFGSSTFIRDEPIAVMLEPFGGNDPTDEDFTILVREWF